MDVGLYGKLPSHGDFLRRRIPDAFVDGWDAWLQHCLAASRAALGERWLDVYLTSPAWRFACAAGACGPDSMIGLMVPSVDRVGRYFPLTLAAVLPDSVGLLTAATESVLFFAEAEQLLVETLAADPIDFEGFDRRVVALGDELARLALPRPLTLGADAGEIMTPGGAAYWRIPIGASVQLGPVFEQLLSLQMSTMYHPMSLWWTEGSAAVDPSCLIAKGLPHPETFAALLDGSWTTHRWWSVSAKIEAAPDRSLIDMPSLRFESAAASDVGKVRSINQDAYLERPEAGLWAVADGLGGHRDGEIASRMVCDALADFEPNSSFEDMIEAARERIHEVNDHLLRATARAAITDRSGSTVVLLLLRGASCAVLWAGDSRVYRWRSGRLERLTRDHSVAESDGGRASGRESHLVTRAVGVEFELSLDLCRDEVRAGDRFLLCSDGLTHSVTDAQIETRLQSADIRAAVDGLIEDTLDLGAPDNVTVILVDTFS